MTTSVFGYEFRRAGHARTLGPLITAAEFERFSGDEVVAVSLVRRRPHRTPEVLGVIFLKARGAYVDPTAGDIRLRNTVLLATANPLPTP